MVVKESLPIDANDAKKTKSEKIVFSEAEIKSPEAVAEFEKDMIRKHPNWISYIRKPSKELREIAISSLIELQAKKELLEISLADFIKRFRTDFER